MSNSLVFIIALIALFLSGFWAINALENFGRAMRLTQFALGFVIMAFATNLPEFFVGINAVVQDQTQLSFGDLIGSNLVNLGFILGLVFIWTNKEKYSSIFQKDIILNLLILTCLFLFISNGYLSQIEGGLLLSFFGLRLYTLHQEQKLVKGNVQKIAASSRQSFMYLLSFSFFAALLLVSAYYVVTSGIKIAENFGISAFVIGLVAVAFSTSLPELVFSIHSVLRKKTSMAVGNLLGSALINFTLILGFIAVIRPISLDLKNVWWSIVCLAVIALVLLIAEFKGIRNKLILGALLMGIYLIYLFGEVDILGHLIFK